MSESRQPVRHRGVFRPRRRLLMVGTVATATLSDTVTAGCGRLVPAAPPGTVLDQAVLGGTRAAWLAARGTPGPGTIGERFPGGVEVTWLGNRDRARVARALYVEVLLDEPSVTAAEASQWARALHPPDARTVRTYTTAAGQLVEVYHSEALGQALRALDSDHGGTLFGADRPGTFTQIIEETETAGVRVMLGFFARS